MLSCCIIYAQTNKKAGERLRHPLLFVTEGSAGTQQASMKTVLVSAFDVRSTPEITPESYLKDFARRINQNTMPMEASTVPEKATFGGRNFWKWSTAFQTSARYNLRVRVCNRKQRLSLDVFLQQPGTRNSPRNRKISRVDSLLGQRKLNLLVGDRWPFAANSIWKRTLLLRS